MDVRKALKRLATLVKNSRAELGMTQREYLALFGDRTPSISNLEKANYVNLPDHGTLQKIAEILRITYWELIKILEETEESFAELPDTLTVEEIQAGIGALDNIDDLLDCQLTIAKKIEKLR